MSKRDASKPRVDVQDTTSAIKPVWRKFPGPQRADALMRVATERVAYAEITAHAKELLDVEVCGVLVGHVCEDDEGVWVHVESVIRGTAARQSNTHVTFTQETWTHIHETLEREHRGHRIVGWYHTHPGFGVEFSEMDLFIQKNFFPDPAQIALVTDPLGGAIAICMNGLAGIEYLDRFWVDGRELPCKRPASASATAVVGKSAGSQAGAADNSEAIHALEGRVSQLLHAVEETRTLYYRMLSTCAMVLCVAIIGTAGYFVWSSFRARVEPPKLNSMVPIPLKVGDKTILIGVGVVEWQVPDELNAIYVQAAHELAEKMAATLSAGIPGSPDSRASDQTTPASDQTSPASDALPSPPPPSP